MSEGKHEGDERKMARRRGDKRASKGDVMKGKQRLAWDMRHRVLLSDM